MSTYNLSAHPRICDRPLFASALALPESQRDSAPKPKVARLPLRSDRATLGNPPPMFPNRNAVAAPERRAPPRPVRPWEPLALTDAPSNLWSRWVLDPNQYAPIRHQAALRCHGNLQARRFVL